MGKGKTLILGLLCGCFMVGCSNTTKEKQLATTILQDSTLNKVDSMARSVIRQGLNAGSGYSQIWARDMNTFIETACEETDRKDLRNAILLFFALQQPNGEMIDGYVLKPEFTWNDNVPYYSDAAPSAATVCWTVPASRSCGSWRRKAAASTSRPMSAP